MSEPLELKLWAVVNRLVWGLGTELSPCIKSQKPLPTLQPTVFSEQSLLFQLKFDNIEWKITEINNS